MKQMPTNLFCLIFITFFLGACDETTLPAPGSDLEPKVSLAETRTNLNAQVSNQLIIPAYEALKTEVDVLVERISIFNQDPTESTLSDAQNSLKGAWLAWQSTAMYLFGPAENTALRAALATYPSDITRIENNILSGSYVLGTFSNKAAVGFPALDYLLNAEDPQAAIDLFAEENRKVYALDLAKEIQKKVDDTLNAWLPSGDNYLGDFNAESSNGTDVGSSLGLLINAMDLHFQRFVRDGKIAIPAGIRSAGVPRPKTIEATFGQYSVELLIENLNAYKDLFMGKGADDKDGIGLYEYLVAIDAEDLAADVRDQYDTAILSAEALSDPLVDEIETDLDKLTDVFLEMQQLVVYLKVDMASLMGISITNQDNDGD